MESDDLLHPRVCHRSTSDLPNDVIIKILLFLSAKSLTRFECIDKSCRAVLYESVLFCQATRTCKRLPD
ncbi:hypothetical protein AAHA92_16471 [Salvia divinorum]|uniref:F-box domain-containing protein n=1 Tax=Salvia divinorum TaxID=28513 RepID=A0ABD1GW42_SALDI